MLALGSTGAQAADSATEALTTGKVSFNARARYEHAAQDGLRDSNALTLRPRLGYTTAAWQGLQAMVEFENVTAIDGDAYNQAGINPGGAGRAVIADPESSEVNQAWLSYKSDKFLLKAGRQRLVYDNARFVGDVAWRQNMQTFDAVSLTTNPTDALTVNYAWLSQINRVFGEKSTQGRWDSNSHLLNAAFKAAPGITVTGYAYLLDFENSLPNSSATYGVSVVGARTLDKDSGARLSWRAEYAHQTDYADQPLDYSADYYVVELGYAQKKFNLGTGWEVLGSDDGLKGFATPLATLHAFNGWADLFLGTPAAGLENLYAWVGGTLPGAIGARLAYHEFKAERGSLDYGTEWNVQFTKAIDKNWSVLLKAADFRRDQAFADVTKIWAQVDFAF
jgi:hypothetical protein